MRTESLYPFLTDLFVTNMGGLIRLAELTELATTKPDKESPGPKTMIFCCSVCLGLRVGSSMLPALLYRLRVIGIFPFFILSLLPFCPEIYFVLFLYPICQITPNSTSLFSASLSVRLNLSHFIPTLHAFASYRFPIEAVTLQQYSTLLIIRRY